MKTKSRPWHREIDPGIRTKKETESESSFVDDALRFYRDLKETIDMTAPGGPEAVASIERSIDAIVSGNSRVMRSDQ